MGIVISIFNQKGGCGKTTSAVNLASQLAINGKKVLVVDMDPQANLTEGFGFTDHGSIPNLLDVFESENPSLDGSIHSIEDIPGLYIVPSTDELSAVELSGEIGIEMVLRRALSPVQDDYDYIFIDIPPSLGKLSMGALVASNFILVPIQAEFYPLRGVNSLMKSYDKIRGRLNPDLSLLGVFVTMYDSRTNISKEADKQVRSVFADKVFKTKINRNVALAESPSAGIPIFLYDNNARGAKDYKNLAKEVENRVREEVLS